MDSKLITIHFFLFSRLNRTSAFGISVAFVCLVFKLACYLFEVGYYWTKESFLTKSEFS